MWLVGWALVAHAQEAAATAAAKALPIEIGAQAYFNAGGVFMLQPEDNKGGDPGLPFNGFAGFSPGAGFGLEFRAFRVVGLEINATRWHQVARSEFTLNDQTWNWSIAQNAWQVPVLFQLTAPTGAVQPNLFVGPEFVFPGDATVTDQAWPLAVDLSAGTDAYTLLTFGFGFEFVPPIPKVDLRIPFDIRLSTSPGYPKSAFDRATYYVDGVPYDPDSSFGTLTAIDYDSQWQYQAAVSLGLAYYFL